MVTCVPLACGNGTLDTGEECDPPASGTCDANCQRIPVCGDSNIDAPEMCDPPNVAAGTCDSMCRGIPIICGNMIVQPGEQCDPPQAGVCSATCQNVAPPTCGDGTVNQTSEQCDDGNTTSGDGCSATCQREATACEMCEAAGSPAQACDRPRWVAHALRDGNRAGSVPGGPRLHPHERLRASACPIRSAATAARPATSPASRGSRERRLPWRRSKLRPAPGPGTAAAEGQVATRFTDPVFPLGRAINLINCDRESCKGPPCSARCNQRNTHS